MEGTSKKEKSKWEDAHRELGNKKRKESKKFREQTSRQGKGRNEREPDEGSKKQIKNHQPLV